MRLILVRHAEAVNVGQNGVQTDFDRHLTAHGHATALALADRLAAMGLRVDAVASSPLVRARQTAEPLLQLAEGATELILCDELVPDVGKPKKVAKSLNDIGARTVVAVSHLPDVSAFANWLVGGGGLQFDKGTVAMIETNGPLDKDAGWLVWLMSPECYRR
jgi:phosphohistidine phosphatase